MASRLTFEEAHRFLQLHPEAVLVYCRTGRRSREAAQKLEELGYTEVYDMGGLVGWPYGLE